MGSIDHDWREISRERREETLSKIPESWRVPKHLLEGQRPVDIPRKCNLMTSRELHITESRAVDILAHVRERRHTAVEVTRAFCKRAAIAHQATNCVAEILFDQALAQAKELDKYMRLHGKPKGILHGLPVSVKEHIFIEGTRATCGLITWADQKSPTDALIVRTFREQGAVFHVKTTNPQTLMALETHSNLFGRTVNPHNVSLTSGGSTGGEGALIAMCGSVLGIGTDIGGSIRVPSGFCGIYGLKPSVGRIPHSGLSGLHDGMQNIIGSVGPMARCVEDLDLFCRAALAKEPWNHEPSMITMPWKMGYESPKTLTIGVIWNDGVVQPHPPVVRALKEAVSSLERSGHTIITWDASLHEALINTLNELYFLDGGKEYHEILAAGRETAVPILEWVLNSKALRHYDVEETWKLNSQLDLLRTLYAKQWNAAGVDAVICPVNPSVASVHNESRYWGYSCVWNALDYSAAVIPAGPVQPLDSWDNYPATLSTSLSAADDYYRNLYKTDGPERYRDAPVSLQIVSRRLQDEKLLGIVGRIEDALRKTSQSARYISEKEQRREAKLSDQPQKPQWIGTVIEIDEPVAVAA